MMIELLNCDCMSYMAGCADKSFALAVVDPEFGIGIGKSDRLVTDKGLTAKSWDDMPIGPAYFDEIFRVSTNQIIWGGNYYALPPTKHCIVWDKVQPGKLSFGMFDFAWTSFDKPNKLFRKSTSCDDGRIHPTQKPVALYRWIFQNYAKPGQRILDTHLGSGSSAIAAHYAGLDFVGMELDEEYFNAATKRFKQETRQMTLFGPEKEKAEPHQQSKLI
jgi:site-specific DNA-methyltransferase (adenine-specific)